MRHIFLIREVLIYQKIINTYKLLCIYLLLYYRTQNTKLKDRISAKYLLSEIIIVTIYTVLSK